MYDKLHGATIRIEGVAPSQALQQHKAQTPADPTRTHSLSTPVYKCVNIKKSRTMQVVAAFLEAALSADLSAAIGNIVCHVMICQRHDVAFDLPDVSREVVWLVLQPLR